MREGSVRLGTGRQEASDGSSLRGKGEEQVLPRRRTRANRRRRIGGRGRKTRLEGGSKGDAGGERERGEREERSEGEGPVRTGRAGLDGGAGPAGAGGCGRAPRRSPPPPPRRAAAAAPSATPARGQQGRLRVSWVGDSIDDGALNAWPGAIYPTSFVTVDLSFSAIWSFSRSFSAALSWSLATASVTLRMMALPIPPPPPPGTAAPFASLESGKGSARGSWFLRSPHTPFLGFPQYGGAPPRRLQYQYSFDS